MLHFRHDQALRRQARPPTLFLVVLIRIAGGSVPERPSALDEGVDAAIREQLAWKEAVQRAREEVSDTLYKLVEDNSDRSVRREVLAIRREAYGVRKIRAEPYPVGGGKAISRNALPSCSG